MMTTDFVALVKRMRAAQQRAARTRSKTDRDAADRLATEVDVALPRWRDGEYLGGS